MYWLYANFRLVGMLGADESWVAELAATYPENIYFKAKLVT